MKVLLTLFFTCVIVFADNNPLAPAISGYYTPEPLGDGSIFSITDYSFDPLKEKPVIPKNLKIEGYPDGEGYYLVQLRGPIYKDMLTQIENTGAKVLGCHSRYIFVVQMNQATKTEVGNLPFVRYIDIYQPGYKLYRNLLEGSKTGKFLVYLFYTEKTQDVMNVLQSLGVNILSYSDTDEIKFFWVSCQRSQLVDIAHLKSVYWIEEWFPSEPENDQAQWVNQKGLPPTDTTRSIWRQNIFGVDQILGYTDTGLDVNHYAFRDPSIAITDTGEFPNHRKVVVFKKYPPASGVGDPDGHGTHVGGTIAGNDSAMGGTDPRDGHCKGARISHLCPIPASSYNFVTVFDVLTNTLRNPQLRARTISNSWWTGTMGSYSAKSMETDLFCWKNKDVVLIKSCGNQGQSSQYRITEPGNAKSILAVASVQNGSNATVLSTYSSRGPAPDGRIKPDCAAPGEGIYSAQRNTTNSYVSMSGTSMSAPSCNACVGMMREYLKKGWYPRGYRNPPDSMAYVSSSLLRAMVYVSTSPNIGSYIVPSEYIGWGRITVDSVLAFALPTPEKRELLLYDDTIGLSTGQFVEFTFTILDSTVPLRAVVAWTDTAAAAGATRALINNLNVRMVSPVSDSFKGNVYANGVSVRNPTAPYDSLNPYECFRINNPRIGLWRLRIMAANVVTARQPYAVVLTGNFLESPVGVLEEISDKTKPKVSQMRLMASNPVKIDKVRIKFFAPANEKHYSLKVYNAYGGLIKNLFKETKGTNEWQILTWDGRDDRNRAVCSGIYFINFDDGERLLTEKLILLK
uniref:Peptidase S8/S53 domain-containing protein n=1 Tax=candidate division WOR-3 bacterium TaxID=2052148 RepID=A0A7V0Z4P9_UNCW3